MVGNGYSGIVTNVLKAILLYFLPGEENEYKTALIFCMLSALILIICAVSYQVLQNNKFFIYYKKLAQNQEQRPLIEDEDMEFEKNALH